MNFQLEAGIKCRRIHGRLNGWVFLQELLERNGLKPRLHSQRLYQVIGLLTGKAVFFNQSRHGPLSEDNTMSGIDILNHIVFKNGQILDNLSEARQHVI